MSRTERLFDLMQLLRRHRRPLSGAVIAEQLDISPRTLYRDIATLQAQGAAIDGAPGLGYVLRPGFVLPPLMFTPEEIEALALGSSWVAARGDCQLGAAARDALAKIAAVLPDALRHELDTSALLVGPGQRIEARAAENPAGCAAANPQGSEAARTPANAIGDEIDDAGLATIRAAIRLERKLVITYRDASGNPSARTIWPVALGFFDRFRVSVAWCELRTSIRHFRSDRIGTIEASQTRYPRRREALIEAWRKQEGIAADKN